MGNYNRAITQLNKAIQDFRKLKIGGTYALEQEANENTIQKIAIRLLRNNVKYALMQDTLPTIIEVINANSGKTFGEKTREKIQAEIQNKLDNNVCVHIYKDEIIIYNRTQYSGNLSVTVCTTYGETARNSITDGENKLQEIDIDDFHTFGEVLYTTNARATAKKLIALHQKALALQEATREVATEFNSLAGGSLESLNYSYDIRTSIIL